MSHPGSASLSTRLAAIVLTATLPIVVLAAIVTGALHSQIRQQLRDEALLTARSAAIEQERLIGGTRHLLVAVGNALTADAASGGTWNTCAGLIANLASRFREYGDLGAYDAHGNLLCNSLRSTPNAFNVADRPWFRAALASGNFTLGDYQIGRALHIPVIIAALPLTGPQGDTEKVVYAGLKLDWLDRLVAQVKLPDGASLIVVDRNGVILAPTGRVGEPMPAALQPLMNDRDAVIEIDQGGLSPSIAAATPLAGSGAHVIVSIPADTMFSTANDMLWNSIFALAAVAILALTAAWVCIQRFVLRQVRVLTETAAQISAGNLEARTGLVHTGDEMGRLARAFDQMAETIEMSVRSRTRALKRANTELSREIQERERIGTVLRDSELRFRVALKHGPITVFSQDRELRLTWIYNPPSGMSGAVIGQTDWDMLPFQDALRTTELKRRVLETGLPMRQELTIHCKGECRIYDCWIEPWRDASHQISGITGAMVDVTEDRAMRDALTSARSAAERADEAKSRFLAAASHDLRQPLQATHLFLDVLLMKLADADLRAIAQKAVESLEAGEGLLNALLDISTLQAGIVSPDIADLPVQRLLSRLDQECAPQAATKGLGLICMPCSAIIRSDSTLLERLLRNLINNAMRYTTQGRILIGCRRQGKHLRIEVWDTGCGIPETELTSIFEEFFQLGNPERDRNRGLGLGLSIVDRMARLLHHPIAVRSQFGKGSVFSVTVPLAGTPDSPADFTESEAPEPVA